MLSMLAWNVILGAVNYFSPEVIRAGRNDSYYKLMVKKSLEYHREIYDKVLLPLKSLTCSVYTSLSKKSLLQI